MIVVNVCGKNHLRPLLIYIYECRLVIFDRVYGSRVNRSYTEYTLQLSSISVGRLVYMHVPILGILASVEKKRPGGEVFLCIVYLTIA